LGTLSNGSPISPAILRAHSASLRLFAQARDGHASLFEIGIGTADWITGSNIAEPLKWSARKIFQNTETAFSRLTKLNKIGGTKNAGVVGG